MKTNLNKSIPLLILFFFPIVFGLRLNAQDDISVDYIKDGRGNYKFYCQNDNYGTYTLGVNFQELRNLRWHIQIPYIREVNHGKTYLFTLEAGNPNQSSTFQYNIAYIKGCLDPEPDMNFNYLLPVGEGKIVRTFPLDYLKVSNRSVEPKEYYAVGFILEEGDTIFAARRGVVISSRDTSHLDLSGYAYSSDDNFIEIFQQDCTFARYEVLSKSLVDDGQKVEAGDPIAIAGGKEYTTGLHVRLMVYYNFADEHQTKNILDFNREVACVPLNFCTKEQQNKQLTIGNMYTGVHPDSIITREMSKRELRKWKK